MSNPVVQPEDVKHPSTPAKDRAAAWLAQKCATVEFGLANVVVVGAWYFLGIEKFPFAFLTLVLSVEAILLTIFVLVEQRLQNDTQRREADADLKNDAVAAEKAQSIERQLNRIERRLKQVS